MIIACYNVYNERKHLPESVASVYDRVDKLIFVDGRYAGFWDDKPAASTDGTLAWLRNKKNDPKGKFEVITTKEPWTKQAIKRTAYLKGKPGDIYLQIDGHEVVEAFKGINLVMDVAGCVRIDLPENAVPISVRAPRIFPHKEGLKYITHAYLITEDAQGNQEFFLNMAWDQQTIMPIEQFDREVNPDSYCLTLRHIGPQRTELEQRKDQASNERQMVEVFDHEHGLDFAVDARVAIDRVAQRLYDHYAVAFRKMGLIPISYYNMRRIVEARAKIWAKQQQELRKNRNFVEDNRTPCPECGWLASCHLELIDHFRTCHKKKAHK